MSRVQMLGLCRFSYPAGGTGFAGGLGDAVADQARLYAPDRLALRFWFFENVCLPSLVAQTDPDFRVVVLHGEHLPEPWLGRLRAACATVPQILLRPLPEGLPHVETCTRVMRAARDPQARAVGEFTIDDDDGLAPDFIAAARQHFGALRPAWRAARKRAALDFACGLVVQAGARGVDLIPVRAEGWAPGMVVFCRPGSTRSIQAHNHRRIHHRIPMLSLPRPAMFLRGAHADNDSRLVQRLGGATRPRDMDGEGALADRFGLDPARLRASWQAFRAG